MIHYKTVYPSLTPIDVLSLDLNNLTGLGSCSSSPGKSMTAPIAEQTTVLNTLRDGVIDPGLLVIETSSPLRGGPVKRNSAAAGPTQPSRYCDHRLRCLNLPFWTTIPISNDFAACAISHYLETDHGHNGYFDVDLFLNDLVERRLEYCSAFLVSSLLSLACVSMPLSFLGTFLLTTAQRFATQGSIQGQPRSVSLSSTTQNDFGKPNAPRTKPRHLPQRIC